MKYERYIHTLAITALATITSKPTDESRLATVNSLARLYNSIEHGHVNNQRHTYVYKLGNSTASWMYNAGLALHHNPQISRAYTELSNVLKGAVTDIMFGSNDIYTKHAEVIPVLRVAIYKIHTSSVDSMTRETPRSLVCEYVNSARVNLNRDNASAVTDAVASVAELIKIEYIRPHPVALDIKLRLGDLMLDMENKIKFLGGCHATIPNKLKRKTIAMLDVAKGYLGPNEVHER